MTASVPPANFTAGAHSSWHLPAASEILQKVRRVVMEFLKLALMITVAYAYWDKPIVVLVAFICLPYGGSAAIVYAFWHYPVITLSAAAILIAAAIINKVAQRRDLARNNEAIAALYTTLGLQPGASLEEVTQARRKLALTLHPDKTVLLPKSEQMTAEEQFKRVQAAYEALTQLLSPKTIP